MYRQFEALNAQLIEARKTVQERERILSLMAAIDRQLAGRRRELSLLVTQLKYEKQDVIALEGLSLQALFYALIGCKEEQLEKETAEYINLKMAAEKCRLTIANLENQLQQFEAELVVFADCDDEYALLKQQRIQLLISLDNFDSKLLTVLTKALAAKQAQQYSYARAYRLGQETVSQIDELLVISPERAIASAHSLQPLLDHFQAMLRAISYQFTPSPQANLPFLHVPTTLPKTGIFWLDLLLYDAEPERKLNQWTRQLQKLQKQIKTKVDVLEARLTYINEEVMQKQEEINELVDQLWTRPISRRIPVRCESLRHT